MKIITLLAACILVFGCGRQPENQPPPQPAPATKSVSTNADAEINPVNSVRWAFASKRDIESAISQLSFKKMQAARQSENLPPEIEAKVAEYERLQSQWMRQKMSQRMTMMRPPGAPAPPMITDIPMPIDDLTLSNQVAQARVPIADILDRRSREYSKYQEQFTPNDLIAEYVKDRYDLVVDSSDRVFNQSAVLFRKSGDIPDITDGVLRLLKEKIK